MADINKELTQIKTAVYGKDVRGSIHDGIKKINTESEGSRSIANENKQRQDTLEQQFDDLQRDYSEANPSTAELVAARTNTETDENYNTIGRRMDAEYQKITSQLNDKADEVSLHEKYDYVAFNLNESTIDFYANEELKASVDISEAGNSQSVQSYIDSLVSDGLIEGVTLSDDSINTQKIVDKAVDNNKLSDSYASVKRLYTSDDISRVKKEGIYYIPSGSIPIGKPSDISDQAVILEHRVYNHTSTIDITLQRITTINKPQVEYIRIFFTDQDAGDFVLSKDKKKVTLTEKNVSKITENGSYLGLSTTNHESVPPELVGSSFLLDVTDFGYDGRFVIQTIYKTSGQINVSYKRFIQVASPENTVYEWFKDYSLIGGSGGKAYDQDLNTFDDVEFSTVKTDALEVSGEVPTGTLSNPPSGLISGDMWADTTDSNEHPVVRIML